MCALDGGSGGSDDLRKFVLYPGSVTPYVRTRRAVTCVRTTWYITETFAGTKTLYWDTLLGAERTESLNTL
jgi:hypothetical protein